MPGYYWTRGDAAVDLLGCRGFVAHGDDREGFYREAIAFLNRRYLSGTVMDERGCGSAAECYESAMMDWGRYEVEPGGTEALLTGHGNLRRSPVDIAVGVDVPIYCAPVAALTAQLADRPPGSATRCAVRSQLRSAAFARTLRA